MTKKQIAVFNDGTTIEAECLHAGQYHAYGNSVYKYTIKVYPKAELDYTLLEESIIPQAMKDCYGHSTQHREDCTDMCKYFTGWYTLAKEGENIYTYEYVEPYCD